MKKKTCTAVSRSRILGERGVCDEGEVDATETSTRTAEVGTKGVDGFLLEKEREGCARGSTYKMKPTLGD